MGRVFVILITDFELYILKEFGGKISFKKIFLQREFELKLDCRTIVFGKISFCYCKSFKENWTYETSIGHGANLI